MNSSYLEMDLTEINFDMISKKKTQKPKKPKPTKTTKNKNKGDNYEKINGIKNCKADIHIGYILFRIRYFKIDTQISVLYIGSNRPLLLPSTSNFRWNHMCSCGTFSKILCNSLFTNSEILLYLYFGSHHIPLKTSPPLLYLFSNMAIWFPLKTEIMACLSPPAKGHRQ